MFCTIALSTNQIMRMRRSILKPCLHLDYAKNESSAVTISELAFEATLDTLPLHSDTSDASTVPGLRKKVVEVSQCTC